MPRQDVPPITRGLVVRGVGCALAVGLGAVAVWLIVTGTSQKELRFGALAGVWGALIGAWVISGNRRSHQDIEPVGPVVLAGDAAPAVSTALAVSLRTSAELDRAEDAAARRAFEARLENLLRREIHTALSREVSALRDEIAELRSELVDKVDGQLRLERIETTRVIGSDLEALQHEIRQLKFATRETDFVTTTSRPGDGAPVRPVVEPARVRPVSRQTAAVEADVQPAREEPARPEPEALPALPPAAMPTPPPAAVPPPAAATEETVRIPPIPATPRPAPVSAPIGDDFAALPRIRPFTEFELDPIESAPSAAATPPPAAEDSGEPVYDDGSAYGDDDVYPNDSAYADDDAYTGRRRRREDSEPRPGGRHARAAQQAAERRHSRTADADDLLARLLERENVRR